MHEDDEPYAFHLEHIIATKHGGGDESHYTIKHALNVDFVGFELTKPKRPLYRRYPWYPLTALIPEPFSFRIKPRCQIAGRKRKYV